jgi:hypothetical protein
MLVKFVDMKITVEDVEDKNQENDFEYIRLWYSDPSWSHATKKVIWNDSDANPSYILPHVRVCMISSQSTPTIVALKCVSVKTGANKKISSILFSPMLDHVYHVVINSKGLMSKEQCLVIVY